MAHFTLGMVHFFVANGRAESAQVAPAKGCSALSSKSYDRRACYVSHMRTRAELLSQIARSARNQHWTSAASTGRHSLISRNELRQSLTLETPVTMKANRSREAT